MTDEWKAWIEADPILSRRGDRVIVRLDSHPGRRQRKHEVQIHKRETGWELAARGSPDGADDLRGSEAWLRNRTMNIAYFVIDDSGMWVCGWVPYAGATADEFNYVLRQVAVEADRFEFLATGADAI